MDILDAVQKYVCNEAAAWAKFPEGVWGGGLAPQTLDHGHYFALILFKLHEIWQVGSQEKIIKTVANRCHILLKLKYTKIDFDWGSAWGKTIFDHS